MEDNEEPIPKNDLERSVWIMGRWGADFSTALNPGVSVGVDLPPDMVRQLGRVFFAEAAAPKNEKSVTQ